MGILEASVGGNVYAAGGCESGRLSAGHVSKNVRQGNGGGFWRR